MHWRKLSPLGACLVSSLLGIVASACAPKIGDDCQSSIDCSVRGDRVCDRTQPGGYCTVQFCDPDTCPDDALCVEWRFEPPRTAESWCMKACGGNGDCRGGYRCVREDADALRDENGQAIAQIVDFSEKKRRSGFCMALPPSPPESVDAGALPDAATSDAGVDAGADAGMDGAIEDAAMDDGGMDGGLTDASDDAAMDDAAMDDGGEIADPPIE